jgi:hypothetical protein
LAEVGQEQTFDKLETEVILVIFGIIAAVLIGCGAYWLFRQRDPGEIYAAREKLERFRKKKR